MNATVCLDVNTPAQLLTEYSDRPQQLFITDSKALVAGQVTQSALVVTLPDTGNGAVTE